MKASTDTPPRTPVPWVSPKENVFTTPSGGRGHGLCTYWRPVLSP